MKSESRKAEIADLMAKLTSLLAAEEREPREATVTSISSERYLLSPEEAATRLSIGRTAVYALIKSGELESVRIGTSRRISVAALKEYVDNLTGQRSTGEGRHLHAA